MNTSATININNARHRRWCRTPHAKLPIARAIAPLIRTNSARSVAKKPNPINGRTATKSGIARQWTVHATERHAPVVSTNSWLKCLFNFISLENRGRGGMHAPVVSTNSWLKCLFNFISLENRGRGGMIEIIVPVLQFQKLSLYKNFTFRPGSGITALIRDKCSRYAVSRRFSISKTTMFSSCHHEKLR